MPAGYSIGMKETGSKTAQISMADKLLLILVSYLKCTMTDLCQKQATQSQTADITFQSS